MAKEPETIPMEIIWLVFQGKFRDGANKAFPLETERDIHGNSQAHSAKRLRSRRRLASRSKAEPQKSQAVGICNRSTPEKGSSGRAFHCGQAIDKRCYLRKQRSRRCRAVVSFLDLAMFQFSCVGGDGVVCNHYIALVQQVGVGP